MSRSERGRCTRLIAIALGSAAFVLVTAIGATGQLLQVVGTAAPAGGGGSGSVVSLAWTQAALPPDWTASTPYAPGQVICPLSGNAGAYEFFAQGSGGSMVSGSSEPTWPQSYTAGDPPPTTASDGGIADWAMVIQGNSAVTCPPVTSNNVYRSTTSGGPYSEIYESSTPITSYTDTPSTGTYYYVVSAVNSNGESPYSSEASASVSSGPPQTYAARIDSCVTGYPQTGCTSGATTGQAGSALSFQLKPTDTVPFAANAPANTAATDPDFLSYLILVTDPTTNGTPTTSYNMGSDGQWDAFSQNSSMFMVYSNGGGPWLYYLNATQIRAQTCSPSSPCLTYSAIHGGAIGAGCSSGCTIIDNSGRAVWSRVSGESNVIYELMGDGVTVNRLVVNSGTDTFTRTQYLQFTSNSPVACSILPAGYNSTWHGVFGVATDGSIALTEAGAADWQGPHAYITNDETSFIYPSVGNSAHHGFQVTTAGTSSGTEPTWSSCSSTCTDGTVTWTNIGSLNGQGPGFDAVIYQTGAGCSGLNTRLGTIRRGAGVGYPAGTWQTTDPMICNKYGSNPCPLTDLMTLHGNSADLNSRYMSITPTHGGGTPVLTPGTANCLATNANYYGAYSGSATYHKTTHDMVYDPSNGAPYSYYVWNNATNGNSAPPSSDWALADVYCYTYTWDTHTLNMNVSTETSAASHTSGHQAQGYTSYWADGAQYQHLYSQPMAYQNVSGVIDEVPYPTTAGSSSAGWTSVALLPNGFPSDHHDSYRNAGTTDSTPIPDFATQVPTITTGYTAAGYGELVGECNGLGTCSLGTMYRFAHEYNTGNSENFSNQNNIGSASQDGQFALWGTDVMGTRGSISPAWAGTTGYALGSFMYPTSNNTGKNDFQVTTAGTSSGTQPNWDSACTSTCTDGTATWTNLGASCNQLRAGFAPAATTAFSAASSIYPVTNNLANNIYSTSAGGTTGSPVPNWNTFCPAFGACPSLDGTVQWVNKGANDCRSDILLGDLVSAH